MYNLSQEVGIATIKFAMVKFDDTPYQQYCFLTDIHNLQIGDTVVVETIRGVKIAKFSGYVALFPQISAEPKWIIQKVDLIAHKKRNVKTTKQLMDHLKMVKLQAEENELMEKLRSIQLKKAELQPTNRCFRDDTPDF